jgi:hypothetical protein
MAYFENETQTVTAPAPRPNFQRNNPATQSKRPNRYAGQCGKCGGRVEAGEGWLTGNPGNWGAEHVDCDATPAPSAPSSTTFPVPEGRYTVEFADGSYRTLRVRRQDEDSQFMPGKILLSYLAGSDNDRDYTSFANVDDRGGVKVWRKHQQNKSLTEALKVLMGSPDAAREAYAEASGCCSRCGRTLTVPASLHAGVGPECARKMGI